jgi:hypothetical protein
LQSLISDIHSVSAKAFGLQVDNLPAVLQVFQNDPKISADELLKVKAGSLAPKMPDSSGKQSPLGAMLGSVPDGGMRSGQNQSTDQKSASPKGRNDKERLASLSGRLTADFMALNEVIPISDFIVIDAQMPLGFLVDVPDSMNICKGNHLSQEQADFRERIWPILAMFSGQCNLDVVNKCTVSSKWLQAINAGEDALRELCTSQGIAVRSGCVYLHSMQIWEAIGDRSGGSAFTKVLSTITEFYSIYPEKAMTPFKLLYAS